MLLWRAGFMMEWSGILCLKLLIDFRVMILELKQLIQLNFEMLNHLVIKTLEPEISSLLFINWCLKFIANSSSSFFSSISTGVRFPWVLFLLLNDWYSVVSALSPMMTPPSSSSSSLKLDLYLYNGSYINSPFLALKLEHVSLRFTNACRSNSSSKYSTLWCNSRYLPKLKYSMNSFSSSLDFKGAISISLACELCCDSFSSSSYCRKRSLCCLVAR